MHQTKFPAISNSRNADKFVVRLPEGMRERIAEVSKERHRSMNSEIIARLEQSLGEDDGVATIHADAQSLTTSEKQMVKAFRAMSAGHQRALIDLISPKHNADTTQLVTQSIVA